MMTGTNARSKTVRVESPRKLRKGPSFRARGGNERAPTEEKSPGGRKRDGNDRAAIQ